MAPKLFSIATLPLLLVALLISLNPFLNYCSYYSQPQVTDNTKEDFGQFEFVPIVGALGPESYAFDSFGGGPYTGISDGRIIKWEENQRRWVDFAVTSPNRSSCEGVHDHAKTEHICGRPLGLRFHKTSGDLYIADAYMGLLRVGAEGGLATRVVTQAQGIPLTFSNGIDIDDQTGFVYFTDSSSRYQRRDYLSVILSGDRTGRLIRYDPKSERVDVILNNLMFPNGVALSGNGDFLLLAETTACRIVRYWLQTPKGGTHEPFADDLPGFPDNIKRSPRGGFWVGIHSRRRTVSKWILSSPRVSRYILGLPFGVMETYTRVANWKARGLMVRLGEEEGSVLDVVEDSSGSKWKSVSEAEERDGTLWVGSIHKSYAGKIRLNGTREIDL